MKPFTPTWMQGSKVYQSITLPPPACLNRMMNPDPPGHPYDDVMHQTRPPTSISTSPVLMLIVRAIRSGQAPLTTLWLCSPRCSQLWCTVCSHTLLTLLWDWPKQASFHSPIASLSMVHWLSFFGPLLVDTNHCIKGKPHSRHAILEMLWQSFSHHNLNLAKVPQILTLDYFS